MLKRRIKLRTLYILADDFGIGDLSFYNENSKIKTPNLDLMGSQGMKFTDAHTSSAVYTPTRYGILKVDVAEKVNVAETYPEQVELLKALLIKQIKEGRTTQGEIQENDAITIDWHQTSFVYN